ncbi:MAG: response regulator transcription factor, partial [Cyclobacteriaceae bacterium]|nr:response regulator transcription factor [Cyclobacteriaceae bacterium]
LLMELVYFLMCALILIYNIKKLQKPISKYIYRFLLLMLAGLVLRGCILPVSFISPWVLAPAILLYFASNFLPLFYLRNTADLIFMPIYAEHKSEEKMELIFKKHQISKREKEIVQHICEGKTNQQIADELFISLQTVKDHTHRIYTKIGIKSRMQLVQMVNT